MPRLASRSQTAASRSHRAVPVVARAVTTLPRPMFPPDAPVAVPRESRRPSLPLSRRLSQTAMRRNAEDGLARETQPPSSRPRPLPRPLPSRQAGEVGLASSLLRLPSLTRRTTMKNSLKLWVKLRRKITMPPKTSTTQPTTAVRRSWVKTTRTSWSLGSSSTRDHPILAEYERVHPCQVGGLIR